MQRLNTGSTVWSCSPSVHWYRKSRSVERLCRLVDRFEPGSGPAVAILLWLGSMLLPFSTIFFSHLLAACLGFGAYYLLWLERSRRDARLLVVAGGLGGLAVTTEYPAAILVVLLGVYALEQRAGWMRRACLYGTGVLLGLLPLFAYNLWAFGSPLRNSYSNVAANEVGLFGLVRPSAHSALDLLFGVRGLLSLTPLVAVAVVGIVLLHREGRRGEARLAGAVVLAYLGFNASYYLPFGGWVPGPRFLIPVIPFLALPLAVALRRLPALTLALGGVSAATMIAATLTMPELADTESSSLWWERLARGEFGMAGGSLAGAWFIACAGLAIYVAARMVPRLGISRDQIELGVAGTAGWVLIAAAGGTLLGTGAGIDSGEVALLTLVVAVGAAVWLWPHSRPIGALAIVPLLALVLPEVQRHYKWAFVLAASSLVLTAVAYRRRRLDGSAGITPRGRANPQVPEGSKVVP